VLPAGTELVSLGTSWGPGLFANTRAEVEQWKLNPPANGLDIVRWEVAFVVSPKASTAAATKHAAAPPLGAAVTSVIGRYAAGWERVSVVRDAETTVYTGALRPKLDVYAQDWLVYTLDGDIRIFQQKNPQLEIALPVTINSRDREFDASLVRAHDGRYALLWARGTSRTQASRFVAFSADLLRWEPPQRLVFDDPAANTRYTYGLAEPLERTYNVVPVRQGYAMLLAQGFVRLSQDLRQWGPPRRAIQQELDQNRLVRARDGTVWAVYQNPSRERQPHTAADWLSGFFVMDGKHYRHTTELGVSRSVDGIAWETAGTVTLPGQPSALWAFAVDDRRIGVALSFNRLTMTWFTVSPHEALRQMGELPFLLQSDEAEWFVRDSELTCVRQVFDPERQKPMLLLTGTKRGWGAPAKP
jgi:hypothetical protein